MIRYGATNNVLSHLASASSSILSPLQGVHLTDSDRSGNAFCVNSLLRVIAFNSFLAPITWDAVRRYAGYLNSRIDAFRELQCDVILVQHRKVLFCDRPTHDLETRRLRRMSASNGLLLALQSVQTIVHAIVECRVRCITFEDRRIRSHVSPLHSSFTQGFGSTQSQARP